MLYWLHVFPVTSRPQGQSGAPSQGHVCCLHLNMLTLITDLVKKPSSKIKLVYDVWDTIKHFSAIGYYIQTLTSHWHPS